MTHHHTTLNTVGSRARAPFAALLTFKEDCLKWNGSMYVQTFLVRSDEIGINTPLLSQYNHVERVLVDEQPKLIEGVIFDNRVGAKNKVILKVNEKKIEPIWDKRNALDFLEHRYCQTYLEKLIASFNDGSSWLHLPTTQFKVYPR